MGTIWAFLQQTAAVTAVALVLLLLQRIFLDKLSPRWQYGVWAVLLLRLVVPAGIAQRSTALDLWPWIEELRAGAELHLSSAYASPWRDSLPAFFWPVPPRAAPASITDWLFVLYLAGALLCVLWFLLCAWRLRRRVDRGVPVSGERLEALRRVAETYDLPLPRRVMECKWDHSPFLLGALRPTLVLPMGWAWDDKVILHELLHLKYHDVAAGWLTTFFRCLHWCNPILWLVFDKIGSDREALCDQRVLEHLEGEDRREYGRLLLSMADDRAVRIPGATTMANGSRAVKTRIQAIARFKRFPRGMAPVSLCITAILALSLVAASRSNNRRSPGPGAGHGGLGPWPPARCTARPLSPPALEIYGKGMLSGQQRHAALMCAAMVTPEADMPTLFSRWEAEERDRRTGWTAGPLFRGLVSDGDGGYLCQVFWFRDAELADGETPPEDPAAWPVDYLCHTVWLRQEDGRWTVTKLDEIAGSAPAPDQLRLRGRPHPLRPRHLERHGGGLSPGALPGPSAGNRRGYGGSGKPAGLWLPRLFLHPFGRRRVSAGPLCASGQRAVFPLLGRHPLPPDQRNGPAHPAPPALHALWQGPEGLTADEENRHIIDPFDEVISLEPGGTVLDNDRSGGGSGSIDMALPRALGPTAMKRPHHPRRRGYHPDHDAPLDHPRRAHPDLARKGGCCMIPREVFYPIARRAFWGYFLLLLDYNLTLNSVLCLPLLPMSWAGTSFCRRPGQVRNTAPR